MARFVIAADKRWHRTSKKSEEIHLMTLGALQTVYKKYCALTKDHNQRMRSLLKKRNSIAHSFYRRRKSELLTDEGRARIIQELNNAIADFQLERDEMYWNLGLVTGEYPL
jgi:hypothetical protein